ncbi:MAG: ABC transporter substrate-binding protein [Acidimicrobiia bacterium]|nr:ABC transporter substrate-binding protein [Acidimicrobiia bacterium]
MANSRLIKFLALLMAFSFAAAACGSDDSGDTAATDETTDTTEATEEDTTEDTTTDTTEAIEDETPVAGSSVDGVLTVGSIIPLTGDLAFLSPPEVAALRLAEEDINAAGGVLGNPIVTIEGDSGDTNVDIANPTVDAQLADGADVIIGAASSAVSKTVIDKITGAGVIQFSMANTSPDFTTYNDNGLYFRTAPSDLLQGKVLADLVAEEGNASMSIIYRQESYGEGLANAIKDNFEASGGTVDEFLAYAVDTENFDPEIDKLVAADSDAYVVVAFQEAGSILTTMNERGIGPVDKPIYGVDGFIEGAANEVTDPSILEGLKGTVPSVDLTSITDFTDRFEEAYGEPVEVLAYGAETYDAVVIVALAAEAAGTDDPIQVAAQINDITRGGDKCTDFASCRDIIAAGGDPDYDGIGGPYEFVDAGEPSAASFRIMTYGADGIDVAQDVYVFAE